MKFESVMLLLVIATTIPIIQTKVLMPKLSITPADISSQAKPTIKHPEERRQLALFPKNIRKFTILPMSYYKFHTTPNPIVALTKKPLMRKIVLQDKRYDGNNIIEKRVTRRPVMNTNLRFAKKLDVFRSSSPRNVIQDKKQELEEKKYAISNLNDKDFMLNGDYTERHTIHVYPVNVQDFKYYSNAGEKIEDIKSTPEGSSIKVTTYESFISPKSIQLLELENSIENCLVTTSEAPANENEHDLNEFTLIIKAQSTEVKSDENTSISNEFEHTESTTLATQEINKLGFPTTVDVSKDIITSTSEKPKLQYDETTEINTEKIINTNRQSIDSEVPYEIADQNEFIFINEASKVTDQEESDFNFPENTELTTEVFIESKLRKERGANVIEEENLASTVSGFKFNVKNTQLSDNLVFKNINS